jgi:hypothetical protein
VLRHKTPTHPEGQIIAHNAPQQVLLSLLDLLREQLVLHTASYIAAYLQLPLLLALHTSCDSCCCCCCSVTLNLLGRLGLQLLPDFMGNVLALKQDVLPQRGCLCLASCEGFRAVFALDRGPPLLLVHWATVFKVLPDWVSGAATLAAAALAVAALAAVCLAGWGSIAVLPCDFNIWGALISVTSIHL